MSGLGQDLSHGLRYLGRQPGFALAAVLTLGLTIGLNSSAFTVLDAVAFQPWAVRDPERVVRVVPSGVHGHAAGFSTAEWRYLSEHTRTFSALTARAGTSGSATIAGHPRLVQFVSGNYFEALGVAMVEGRGFRPEEDRPDAPAVAVLSHARWASDFGADPSVIGRNILVDDMSFTVVGVASPHFRESHVRGSDAWLPQSARPRFRAKENGGGRDTDAGHCCVSIAGRLAPGISRAAARAELETLSGTFRAAAGLPPQRVHLYGTAAGDGLAGAAAQVGKASPIFITLGLLLLLACANVGNLLLARAYARGQEIAIRLAVGATRARVVRQLLVESFVLAFGAGLLGLAVASFLPERVTLVPEFGHLKGTLAPDERVLAFTLVLSTVACFAFGLAPALHCTRTGVSGTLKDRHGVATRRFSLRQGLLAVQVAIGVTVLAGAGLLLRGVRHAHTKPLGFAMEEIAVVTLHGPWLRYEASRQRALGLDLIQATEAVAPGTRIAFAAGAPLRRQVKRTTYRLPGDSREHRAAIDEVSPAYFDVLGLRLLAGQALPRSTAETNGVLVNETLARRAWASATAVGQTIELDGVRREVIGVVSDAFVSNLLVVEPLIYEPLAPEHARTILVRDADGGLAAGVATIAARVHPDLRATLAPLSVQIERRLSQPRMIAAAGADIGLFALALAAVGLFGVFAYAVQQRTREIGIRIALGARPVHVCATVLSTASRPLLLGLVVGAMGAVGVSFILHTLLFGLSPLDPVAIAGVAALLALAALLATWLPARRAMRIDPTVALRYE